jgi:hypothetical protein
VKPRITVTSAFDPPGIRLGVVRGISYGLFGKPGEFVPQARALGWSRSPAATGGRRWTPCWAS